MSSTVRRVVIGLLVAVPWPAWALAAAPGQATAVPSPPSAPSTSPSPGSTVLTLEQCVRDALGRNLRLAAARDDVAVAEAGRLTASLRPNPVLTVGALQPQRNLFEAATTPYDQLVRTDWVFERGGKRQWRVDEAGKAESEATFALQDAVRALVLDVESAYVDVQLAKMNLALAQENLTAFNAVVGVNTERVRTGDLAPVELARSRLAALQFQNDVEQRRVALVAARNRLATLTGRGADGSGIDVVEDLRHDEGPVDVALVRTRALADRPDLQAARAAQARSVSELRLQLANGRIDYTLSGEFHRQEGPGIRGNTYGAFFSVPVPIFNRNQGEIARATVQQHQRATEVQARELDVTREVADAFTAYRSARDVLDRIERDMLRQARDVRTATEYSYRRGEASFVEFLDAVRAFNDTMQSYNQARADYARSLYTLDAISGKVTP